MRLFRTACFEAARAAGGRASVLSLPGPSTFEAVTVTGRGASHTVLCHTHLPLIAFLDAPPVPGQEPVGFTDPPTWAGGFEAVGLRALGVAELSTPMSAVDMAELAECERAQVRYWQPDVLSDLLFNRWD